MNTERESWYCGYRQRRISIPIEAYYPKTKKCSKCGKRRAVDQFNKHTGCTGDLNPACRTCTKAYHREYYASHKKLVAASNQACRMRRLYGLSEDELKRLKRKQRYRCAICKRKIKLHVDHNHKTKEVRGLLCGLCNKGLGCFKDKQAHLYTAIRYLEEE